MNQDIFYCKVFSTIFVNYFKPYLYYENLVLLKIVDFFNF